MKRRWFHATWLTVITLLLPPVKAQAAVNLIAGACTLQLEVTTTANGWRDITTPLAGDCETSDGEADGYLGGEFGPFPTFDCEGGVGDGHADFQLDFTEGGSPGWLGADLDVTNKAGVIEIVFFELGSPHLLATGTFVQLPAETLACMGGADTVTWTGAIVFEDPEISP